jgi:serine protease AprX
MKNKTFITRLLMAIIVTSCASPFKTTITPPIVVSTQTSMPVSTNTNSLFLTQIAETQVAKLIEPYQYEQSEDLTPLGHTLGESVIETLWFTQSARWWSTQDKQTAQNILQLGMNPGLGIRELHAEGITGKGVTVAIIDQNMILNHPEFRGKILKYYDMGTNQPANMGSMHGPAVTSLLVGENIGTAPDAKIYYVAVPSWLLDAQYYADALDWIVAENEKLPKENKIRVVSVSSIPSGIDTEYTKNNDAWDAAYKRATDAGILVLDCTYEHGYTVPCTYDLNDPDNVAKCIPNWGGPTDSPHKRINIPTRRTTALERDESPIFSYQYTGIGGISWTVPYLSGVLAMGWQINPDLTNSQLLDMLYASAYVTNRNMKVIDPWAFIEIVGSTTNK